MSSLNYHILPIAPQKCLCQIFFVLVTCLMCSQTENNAIAYEHFENNVEVLNENSPCDSIIYCHGGPGTILHTVQMSKLYNDSKTFVDKPLKYEPNQTIENFEFFMRVIITVYLYTNCTPSI